MKMMRSSHGLPLLLLTALALALLPGAASAAGGPAEPSCAEGPVRVGDTIEGTPCADRIVAAPTVARVEGGGGNDTIVASPVTAVITDCSLGACELGVGSQTFEGGPGNDVVFGQRGNDILRGNGGNDRLYGGIGDDLLEGGPGNDLLSGGFGADGIDGGPGSDYVRGDGTQDEIVDTGTTPGDVDTLSFSTGVTPGFTRSFGGHAGFPPAGGERGVYLDLAANIANNGEAPEGGGADKIEGSNFERIVGTPFSDYIAGSMPGQEIFGGGGGDVLVSSGAGTKLRGGAGGDDCENAEAGNAIDCESTAVNGPVATRNTSKVSVGLMAPGEGDFSQVYLVGSGGSDEVTVTWTPSPESLRFHLAGGSFELDPGCTAAGSLEAICELAKPLDSVLAAGMGGDDKLLASGLPATTSLMLLGGEGADELTAGDFSDDTLADGPGNDVLHGLGGDDALLNNGGSDRLYGETGNDLFLSTAICEGDGIDGGEGRDNASWAKFGEGVEARLDSGLAGRPVGGQPQCPGGALDSLAGIEDLEGSNSADTFVGDGGENQMLGHAGADTYLAGGGPDTILANSADFDPTIDCGEDIDEAVIDRPQYGDVAAADCENVFEADPNNFRNLTRLPLAVAPAPPPAPDTKPPRTKLGAHPGKLLTTRSRHRRVAFHFSSSEPGSHFRCKLDAKPYRACTSPHAYNVGLGRHTVRVDAVDAAGNADRSPALFRFLVRHR
ncbi:MAG: hypothetical protein H0X42_03225 [Solirubrobacterales bacterium]|nr:hypothetical protein [Solirubrobacterales bacterium]